MQVQTRHVKHSAASRGWHYTVSDTEEIGRLGYYQCAYSCPVAVCWFQFDPSSCRLVWTNRTVRWHIWVTLFMPAMILYWPFSTRGAHLLNQSTFPKLKAEHFAWQCGMRFLNKAYWMFYCIYIGSEGKAWGKSVVLSLPPVLGCHHYACSI